VTTRPKTFRTKLPLSGGSRLLPSALLEITVLAPLGKFCLSLRIAKPNRDGTNKSLPECSTLFLGNQSLTIDPKGSS